MEMVYEATPRRLQISDNDDEDDEDVLYTAKGLQQMDKETLIKGSSASRGVANIRAPSKLDVTLTLFLSFFGLGVILSLLGPTLLDLSYNVKQSLTHVAIVFTTRSVGYLFGTVTGGFLFDKFDANFLLALALPMSAIGTIIAPLWTKVALLAVSTFVQGISMGFLDTGGNVLLLRTWGKDNGPYMQALHFSFALGALVAPLIAQPFISPAPTHNCTLLATTAATMMSSATSSPLLPLAATVVTAAGSALPAVVLSTTTAGVLNATAGASATAVAALASSLSSAVGNGNGSSSILAALTVTAPLAVERHRRAIAGVVEAVTTSAAAATAVSSGSSDACPLNPVEFTGRFKYAFFIAGAPLLLAGALFACFSWRKQGIRHIDDAPAAAAAAAAGATSDKDANESGAVATEDDASGNGGGGDARQLTGCVRWQFLVLLALLFLIYVGQEVGFGSYIFAYGVRSPQLRMTSTDAALLTATFWGLFAVGRFLAIPLAYFGTPPGLMVAVDLVLALVASVGLLLFQGSRTAVWLGSALMGISLASVFPSAISWAEQYTEINSKATIVFVVGAAVGEMSTPLLFGYLFEDTRRAGPRSLVVASVVIIALGVVVFALLVAMARGRGRGRLRRLCRCCPGVVRGLGGRGGSLESGKRRNRKTRRQRNLDMEMAKQARPGDVARHAWRSSESDTV